LYLFCFVRVSSGGDAYPSLNLRLSFAQGSVGNNYEF